MNLPFDGLDILALTAAHGPFIVSGSALWLATVVGGRFAIRRWRANRFSDSARLIEISVPPHVEADSAAAWWAHLLGLTSPWWKRTLFGQAPIGWEYVADSSGVRIQVWVPGTVPPGLVEKTIVSAWPGSSVTTRPAEPLIPLTAASRTGGTRLAREDHFPLRSDFRADPLRALLGTVSGLRPGERIVVQILARPVTGHRLRKANRAAAALRTGSTQTRRGHLFDLLTPARPDHASPGDLARQFPERAEEVRAILAKAGAPRFAVQIGYAVTTERREEEAARGWLRGRAHEVASTFALYSSGHQYLRRARRLNQRTHLNQRRVDGGFLLSVPELAALAHLPYDAAAPGVTRAGARPVAPPPSVPSGGRGIRVLGDAETGHRRPVAVAVAGTRQHLHVLGQTGVGKSTFLANLIIEDAKAGRGALVIDPKGDLINDVLNRAPERVIDRTVIFDPGEAGPPPCLNVLAGPDASFAVDSVVTIFRRCFSSSWGPRLDDLLRSACLTLVHAQGDKATLSDIPRLLTDTPYRSRVVRRVRDELLVGFWAAYDDLTPAARASVIGPVMNKLRAVLLRPFVRDALSGGPSTFDVARLLDSGGLVLARLPKGVLGEDAARLLGSLLLAHTWQSILPRAKLPEDQRRDVAAYVDEAHNFLNLPGSVSDLLAEARAYHLSLTIAHQHLSQLPRDLREAVSADARNKIYFATSPEDAVELSRHVGPLITAHDLAHLGAYQAAGRVMCGSAPSAAFTFRTRPLPEPIAGRQEEIRAAAHAAFARPNPTPHATLTAPVNDPRAAL